MMSSQPLNILVVDDLAGIRLLLSAIIEEEGHRPYTASNGVKVFEIMESVDIHLIFLDLKLPEMDGLEVMAKFKQLDYRPYVVAMTGFAEQEVINSAFRGGALQCFVKPFDVDDIRAVIREVAKNLFDVPATCQG